jgi:GTP-binding protein
MKLSDLPLIAIVGRANVGKSTLFNRVTGRRRALVSKEPGMTRDRRIETAEWAGRYFRIVDTGGLEGEFDTLSEQISFQVKKAVKEANLILFVVDGQQGMTAQDEEIAAFLRQSDRPIYLLVNKVDTPHRFEPESDFHRLGFARVFSISADHGLNVDEVLDAAIEDLEIEQKEFDEEAADCAVVILGKPNVGKSTFLNALLGEERLVTSEIAGTTRDTVDVRIQANGRNYRFVDTAGIRKKGATKTVPDKLAVIHARKSLERADLACIMIDGSEGITHQDAVLAGYAREAGKGIILLLNKMDLLTERARKTLEMEVVSKLKFISFAPRLYTSARTGHNVGNLLPLLEKVYSSYTKRVSTGQLNTFFDRSLANRYLGSYRGKPIKLKYITQAGIKPPTFILFTNASATLHFSHMRYLENELRKQFGFEGTVIRIKVRKR